MRDKTLIIESLEQLEQVIENLLESTSDIQNIGELPKSADGILRLSGFTQAGVYARRQFCVNLQVHRPPEPL